MNRLNFANKISGRRSTRNPDVAPLVCLDWRSRHYCDESFSASHNLKLFSIGPDFLHCGAWNMSCIECRAVQKYPGLMSLLLSVIITETPDRISDSNRFFRMLQNWKLMRIAWISMEIAVSELKQPWSVLLLSNISVFLRAETAVIITKNLWLLLKITGHRLRLMKIT